MRYLPTASTRTTNQYPAAEIALLALTIASPILIVFCAILLPLLYLLDLVLPGVNFKEHAVTRAVLGGAFGGAMALGYLLVFALFILIAHTIYGDLSESMPGIIAGLLAAIGTPVILSFGAYAGFILLLISPYFLYTALRDNDHHTVHLILYAWGWTVLIAMSKAALSKLASNFKLNDPFE